MSDTTTKDEKLGMAWWNGLSRSERLLILTQAGEHHQDPSVADAWKLWQAGRIFTDPMFALAACRDCGKPISRTANQCPYCHHFQ
jgi:hypothetical protein